MEPDTSPIPDPWHLFGPYGLKIQAVCANPVLRAITTDSITRLAPVNQGFWPISADLGIRLVALYTQLPAPLLVDLSNKSAYPRMPPASPPVNITQNL